MAGRGAYHLQSVAGLRGESEQKPLELWGNTVASRASDRFRERSCSSLAPGFLGSPNAGVGAEAAHYELPEPPKRKGIPSNTLSLAGGLGSSHF